FVYERINLYDGLTETIGGNEDIGFRRTRRYADNDIQNYDEFYPTGELKKSGYQYVGELKQKNEKDRRREIFNIGKWTGYDKQGKIINEINYERNFEISLSDVKRIINEKNITLIQNRIAINRETKNHNGIVKNRW